ncbi:ribosome assembly protein 4, partial [Nostocaceae cyanobacterium CENA357]|nr:ribosome assembly protein 4 [Atlanticothrix silvestris CENA357]
MTQQHPPEDFSVNNNRSLQQLAWAIEASVGQFKLILARCNYASLRDRLIDQLREICSVEIQVLYLRQSQRTLYTAIREEFGDNLQALMVVGLDSLQDLPQMLTSANQVREEFRKSFAFPLVLWINAEVHQQLMQLAPDLESWATTKNFAIANSELIDLLQQTAAQLFDNYLSLSLEICIEIKSAWQDLQYYKQDLTPQLKANCDFLLGLVESINRNLDAAIEYYQQSLLFWQENHNLERQGKILTQITICHYEKEKNRPHNLPQTRSLVRDFQSSGLLINNFLQRALDAFTAAQRPDLIADSIDKFGVILRYLQAWEQFKTLAEQALIFHESENNTIKIAQDYGFLAEVALAQKNWQQSQELAQKALDILSTNHQFAQAEIDQLQKILLIIAQAQQHLKQYQSAIDNLTAAREIGITKNDPQIYIHILRILQKLFYQQQQYLSAFDAKLERRSVEQQFGLRAFIGAGRLQATKRLETPNFTPKRIDNQGSVAPEIAASGRQLDVDRLIERIGRNDRKLIVIHGQSGVGKSSLVNAGLVPALRKQAIGIQDNLPVVMRVYTNWMEELGRLLGVSGEAVLRLTSATLSTRRSVTEEQGGEGVLPSEAQGSRVFDTQPRVFDTRSPVSDTQPRVFDTHAPVSDTQPRVFDTRSPVSDTQP